MTYDALRHGLHPPFGGEGAIRTMYFLIRWTHIPPARLIAFLVPRPFAFAWKGQYERHKAWAKWAFPIWFYVSMTGVLVYFFLYVWWPTGKQAHRLFQAPESSKRRREVKG